MPEIDTSGSMAAMGNGALLHGPSYGTHRRLYPSGGPLGRGYSRYRRLSLLKFHKPEKGW